VLDLTQNGEGYEGTFVVAQIGGISLNAHRILEGIYLLAE
jgi:hypothetical protein